ncbi:MAG: inositol monophosphatase family protein [Thiotrichaceae bacterium]|jgi:histidinol-phosphatase|uniref:Inositol monophosphatase family protein n=1 Tax=Candidatus Thiocaldithrix dubininis TaxID=3080823 RepID=A0AA95H619_9GAMM|nr:MAG: inositol monophosphatase family protein [Candidatus Thiocaldithrix dubininis]
MSLYLQTALDAVHAAQDIILQYYHGDFAVELKPDQSPVTIADVQTEQTIKNIILDRFPNHGFFGEETGKVNAGAEFNWLIDPIDGTKSFVRGYPMFSTQIALMQGDELILGVSNAPGFNELAYAEKGKGAFLNNKPINVSGYTALNQAALSLGNIASLAASAKWANLGQIITQVQRIRGYGDFLHYHLLASGKIDAIIESDVNILDIAALSVIVREAGGIFTDLSGGALNLETKTVLAAASAEIHADLLARLN